mgnify:CR=1 FL=1
MGWIICSETETESEKGTRVLRRRRRGEGCGRSRCRRPPRRWRRTTPSPLHPWAPLHSASVLPPSQGSPSPAASKSNEIKPNQASELLPQFTHMNQHLLSIIIIIIIMHQHIHIYDHRVCKSTSLSLSHANTHTHASIYVVCECQTEDIHKRHSYFTAHHHMSHGGCQIHMWWWMSN